MSRGDESVSHGLTVIMGDLTAIQNGFSIVIFKNKDLSLF